MYIPPSRHTQYYLCSGQRVQNTQTKTAKTSKLKRDSLTRFLRAANDFNGYNLGP